MRRGAAVGAVLELARLPPRDCLPDVEGRPCRRLRVRACCRAGRGCRPSLPTAPIMSGVAIATSKSCEPPSIFVARSADADDVCARVGCLLRLLALGEERRNALLLAGAVREHQRPAELLIGMAQALRPRGKCDLDRLVELLSRQVLEQLDRIGRRIRLLAVDAAPAPGGRSCRAPLLLLPAPRTSRRPLRLPECSARPTHSAPPAPIERAVPAMTFRPASTSHAFRSCYFASAIERSCAWVRRPTFSRFGSPEPLLERQRLLDQHGRRRRLGDERERAVLEDGDLDGDDPAVLGLGLGVERLAELHDVDTVLASAGPQPAGWPGSPARRGSAT